MATATPTEVLSISPFDSLIYPTRTWFDNDNEIVIPDPADYYALFNLIVDTELSTAISSITETNELVWLDSTTFHMNVSNESTIYVADNVASQLVIGNKVLIENELMTITGIGAYTDDKLELRVKRVATDTTYLDSTSVYAVYDLVKTSNINNVFWRTNLEAHFNDSTAWDSTTWDDQVALAALMPINIIKNIYSVVFDSTASGHQKGILVEIYAIFRSSATINGTTGEVYYVWPSKPVAKKGVYRGTFELVDKTNVLGSVILPRATPCGNRRTYIINVGDVYACR